MMPEDQVPEDTPPGGLVEDPDFTDEELDAADRAWDQVGREPAAADED